MRIVNRIEQKGVRIVQQIILTDATFRRDLSCTQLISTPGLKLFRIKAILPLLFLVTTKTPDVTPGDP